MKYIFLDTSDSHDYFLAIIYNNKVYKYYLQNKDPSAELASFFMKSLNKLNLTIDDIDKYFIYLGIGSYQGLKNGLSFLQGLCDKKNNLFGLTIFDFLNKDHLILLKSWKPNEYIYWYKNKYYLEAHPYQDILNKFFKSEILISTNDINIDHDYLIEKNFFYEDHYLLNLDNYYTKHKLIPIYSHNFNCYLLKV